MPAPRYVCIHGHFYQPPRENPWLEAIEAQDSAQPFHDWNERITAECYKPNARARVLDERKRIVAIRNNYARISFNFGPTLLSWLHSAARPVHDAIVEGDRASRERFGGHGSALAQAYNHTILPLSNRRDKVTQVRWGLRDFEHRFGREAEGMWLPETAADLETLEVLAEHGLRFTILAPGQAARFRALDQEAAEWTDVSGGRIDPGRAYLQRLPSGREIVLFFYDGPVSRAVAFERLLESGENLAGRILGLLPAGAEEPRLAHIATDGESYGHHHRFGEMALAYALEQLEREPGVELINYGLFLERHPPRHEVEILESTSWSCIHGVERWRSDCGCNAGRGEGWSQQWRGPLRAALDTLRDFIAPLYEEHAQGRLADPWAARDAYIDVLLDRPGNLETFLAGHARGPLPPRERVILLELLELQRNALLMYTSCGWFFDEISGLESVQVLQYAGRCIELARRLFGRDPEPGFLEQLAGARSNLPQHADGAQVYLAFVQPHVIDLEWVAAHYAISSLFEDYAGEDRIYCYAVERKDQDIRQRGKARLASGRLRVTSIVTGEEAALSYAVLHLGDHTLHGGVRRPGDEADASALLAPLIAPFEAADMPALIRAIDAQFGGRVYSLRTLFRDEQRKVLASLVEQMLAEEEGLYAQLYDEHVPLMRFMAGLGAPLPGAFRNTAAFVLQRRLRAALLEAPLDAQRLRALADEAARDGIALESSDPLAPGEHSDTLRATLERLSAAALEAPLESARWRELEQSLAAVEGLPFSAELSSLQDDYWQLMLALRPERVADAQRGVEEARAWLAIFDSVGERLGIAVR